MQIRITVEADRSNGGEIILELAREASGDSPGVDTETWTLDAADALFLARRLLEELETFEGLSR